MQDKENKKNTLSPEYLTPFFIDYGKNILWLSLSGGEISIYEPMDELIDLIRKYCPHLRLITFTTNALLPQRSHDIAVKIAALAPDHFITISLDGDEKTHDHVRGISGNYKRAQECFAMMKQSGINVHFGLTASSYNLDFLKTGFAKLSQQIKAVSFAYSGGIYKKENAMNDSAVEPVLSSVLRQYKVRDIGQFFEFLFLKLAKKFYRNHRESLPIPCEVISASLHLRPDGQVHPCMFLPSLGNIKDFKVSEILQKSTTREVLGMAKRAQCQKCWMNCYAPHSMMRHPFKTIYNALF